MRQLEITRFAEPDHATAEGLNILATSLSCCGSDIRRIMITSRHTGEGKTYVVMNLMRTLAGIGRRVVLVDADLRTCGLQSSHRLRFGKNNVQGLSEYLSGHCSFESAVYQTNIPNAYMVPAGHKAVNPFQLLESERMARLLSRLGKEFDLVLLDTPPAGMLADAITLAKHCDGALLVVGYRRGKQREIGAVVESIRRTGCPVLGAVLNEVNFNSLSNRRRYYSFKRRSSIYSKGSVLEK